jgi:lipopolysaccharide export system protein LptC
MPTYSTIVRLLRIMVPAAGIILLVIFFLWPAITRIRLPKMDKAIISGDRTELINPHYEGKDENGQRYTITADRAIQVRATPDILQLQMPTATLEKKDNTDGPHVTAKTGTYQNKTGQLTLTDGVVLTTPEGEKFTTAGADVDLKNKTVASHQPITGGGPQLDLSGQGLTYDEDEGLLTVSGPAKLVLHETDKSAPAAAPAVAPAPRSGG